VTPEVESKIEALRAFEDAGTAYTEANNTGRGLATALRDYRRASRNVLGAMLAREPTTEELEALTRR